MINAETEEDKKKLEELKQPVMIWYNNTNYYNYDKSIFDSVKYNYQTSDVFAIGNEMKGMITINLKNNDNLKNINLIILNTESEIPLTIEDLTRDLSIFEKEDRLLKLTKTQTNSYIGGFKWKPSTDKKQSFILFSELSDRWLISNKYDLPTFNPEIAKLQAETNRAIQRQIIETDNTNDVIEGLTQIIIGLTLIGFVIGFLHLTVEKYFLYKDDSDHKPIS